MLYYRSRFECIHVWICRFLNVYMSGIHIWLWMCSRLFLNMLTSDSRTPAWFSTTQIYLRSWVREAVFTISYMVDHRDTMCQSDSKNIRYYAHTCIIIHTCLKHHGTGMGNWMVNNYCTYTCSCACNGAWYFCAYACIVEYGDGSWIVRSWKRWIQGLETSVNAEFYLNVHSR